MAETAIPQLHEPASKTTTVSTRPRSVPISSKSNTEATSRRNQLQERVNGRFNHDSFSSHARASAEHTGCHFLFEFPAALIDAAADKAAAILCPGEDGHSVLFMAYEEDNRRIRVLEAREAPAKLVDFAFSFARVISYLPSAEKMAVN